MTVQGGGIGPKMTTPVQAEAACTVLLGPTVCATGVQGEPSPSRLQGAPSTGGAEFGRYDDCGERS